MGHLNVVSDYLRAFASDQRGAAAAEYVMILAIVGTGLAMAIFLLSGAIGDGVTDAAELINNVKSTGEAGCDNHDHGGGDGGGEGGGGGEGTGHGEGGHTC